MADGDPKEFRMKGPFLQRSRRQTAYRPNVATGQNSTGWVAEIMLVRLKLCSVAIIASITITSVTFLVMGDLVPAAAAIAAQLIAAIVLLTVRSGRVPVSWSGALVFLEWLTLVVAVQAARSVAGPATAESWMVLLVVGYSIGQ